MRSNQWYVLGFAFLILMIWFIKIDLTFNCNMFSVADENLDKADMWCVVNSEIYDPFIYLFAVLWIVCWINAWLEHHSKKKQEKESLRKIMSDAKDKDFAMKVAQKLKLKHLPQDIPELVYWGKKEGKEKEVDKAIEEKTERWLLGLELFKEKNKRYKPKEMDKEWIAKMKKKYPDEEPYKFADYEM